MTTALYRRYRPETFADVIGQEHVTEPLMQALRSGRITHAYLFSGPRGCGKTTSARILARCLNCAEGPTDVPCGTCPSCVELSRGGSGSLDVVEIDAASHNGVDDARDLRERAAFAPARDRFKIFILDEAHMVTPQGFNALLKIVEEPPPHVKFIFATTEPDKVIGTIRSRTHHYPFRLVPPAKLESYLELICREEGAKVSDGVLPLVVRAGGGSVRDSLSVLDQLVAGSDANGLDYERAIALLGYTHAVLLDEMVDAIADGEAARVFAVVDQVIDTGHAPRRFVEDLLERLRDLIVIAAVGKGASAVLRSIPADQLDRMREQSSRFGASELSRAADTVNQALTDMVGATSPRLHLELLCARILLPAIDDSQKGIGARLDRVERSLSTGTIPNPPVSRRSEPPAPRPQSTAGTPTSTPTKTPASASPLATPTDLEPAPYESPADPSETQTQAQTKSVPDQPAPEPSDLSPEPYQSEPTPVTEEQTPAPPPQFSNPDTAALQQRWPEVLAALAKIRRVSWALVSEYAQVVELNSEALVLSFSTPALATTFANGSHSDMVRQAVQQALNFDVRVDIAGESGASTITHAGGTSQRGALSRGDGREDRAQASPANTPSEPEPPQEVEWGEVVAPGSAPRTHEKPAAQRPIADQNDEASRPEAARSEVEPQATVQSRQEPQSEFSRVAPVPGDMPVEPPDLPGEQRQSSADSEPADPALDRPNLDPSNDRASGSVDEPRLARAFGASSPSHTPAHDSSREAGRPGDADTVDSDAEATSARAEPKPQEAEPKPKPKRHDSARVQAEAAVRVRPEDDVASIDDADAENSGLMGAPLIERMLGGVIIDEVALDE